LVPLGGARTKVSKTSSKNVGSIHHAPCKRGQSYGYIYVKITKGPKLNR
jgi:hypothetical protein